MISWCDLAAERTPNHVSRVNFWEHWGTLYVRPTQVSQYSYPLCLKEPNKNPSRPVASRANCRPHVFALDRSTKGPYSGHCWSSDSVEEADSRAFLSSTSHQALCGLRVYASAQQINCHQACYSLCQAPLTGLTFSSSFCYRRSVYADK